MKKDNLIVYIDGHYNLEYLRCIKELKQHKKNPRIKDLIYFNYSNERTRFEIININVKFENVPKKDRPENLCIPVSFN